MILKLFVVNKWVIQSLYGFSRPLERARNITVELTVFLFAAMLVLHLHHRSHFILLALVCEKDVMHVRWQLSSWGHNEGPRQNLEGIWFDILQLCLTVLVFLWTTAPLQAQSNQKEVPLPGRVSLCVIKKRKRKKKAVSVSWKDIADSWFWKELKTPSFRFDTWAGVRKTSSLLWNSVVKKVWQIHISVWSHNFDLLHQYNKLTH